MSIMSMPLRDWQAIIIIACTDVVIPSLNLKCAIHTGYQIYDSPVHEYVGLDL